MRVKDVPAEQVSATYLQQWTRLVSTTNWEKGRLICQWREALAQAGSPPEERTDEAWSQRVGQVTSQHVGRLRRVHERFGQVQESYSGLYWSHFLAALDWGDAEMWLEGAVQNGWSVQGMRSRRADVLAVPPGEPPVESELDEDAELPATPVRADLPRTAAEVDTASLRPDSAEGAELPLAATDSDDLIVPNSPRGENPLPPAPFAEVGLLPIDLADPIEALKLAIIRHRLAGWSEVAPDAVRRALAGLLQLTEAAS